MRRLHSSQLARVYGYRHALALDAPGERLALGSTGRPLGERRPRRQLDVRDVHAASGLCGSLRMFECLLSEAAAIVGRGFTGVFAKRGGKRACLAKSDIKSNLRYRQLALCQQGFGPFDSPAGQILVRRHAERLLECTRKMVGAELRQLSQRQERDFIGKMLFDILRQLLLLPEREPSARVRRERGGILVHARELVRQGDTQRFDIGLLGSTRTRQLRLQLQRCFPDVRIKEEQTWLEFDLGESKFGAD